MIQKGESIFQYPRHDAVNIKCLKALRLNKNIEIAKQIKDAFSLSSP